MCRVMEMATLCMYKPPLSVHAATIRVSPKILTSCADPNRLCSSSGTWFSRGSSIARSSSSDDVSAIPGASFGDNSSSNFSIIEGPESVQDFASLQLQEIQDNIKSRRNRIFLLMEEVRRLRVQERSKSMKVSNGDAEDENELLDLQPSIPFLPRVTQRTLKQLYLTSFTFISGIILFGGLIAPTLKLKLGLGGTSYEDFIYQLHLPLQLSQVDPIVASFSGGAVGVISALMVLEINNVKQQEKNRCKYCCGAGYLACGRCSGSGLSLNIEPIIASASDRPLRVPTTRRCSNCSGSGKVMCPTCLCTGMVMASEHDPRIEPF